MFVINKLQFSKCIQMYQMRSKVSDFQFVKKLEFFCNLEEEMFNKIFPLFVTRVVEKGKKIYDVGEVSEEMFIIRSGSVAKYVPISGGGNEGSVVVL